MYVKTQWVNNTTPINDTNLNKMEQGIYDNSLVVDAVTNTINPTDTETYKTAELTEGQITDVIGVSDILIKGQTLQDGEPTPSSPVDVNVVSGSNVVNTSNKNLLKTEPLTAETISGITFTPVYIGNQLEYVNVNGTASETVVYVLQNASINQAGTFKNTLSAGTYTLSDFSGKSSGSLALYIRYSIDGTTYNTTHSGSSSAKTFTINKKCKYVTYIRVQSGQNVNNVKFYPMLEQNSTATTYEAHQGKELSLDLGSIELCKIGNYQDYFYKSGSKWYLHKEIGKVVLDGSETWGYDSQSNYFRCPTFNFGNFIPLEMTSANKNAYYQYSNRFIVNKNWSGAGSFRDSTTTQGIFYPLQNTGYKVLFRNTDYTTTSDFANWLNSNNTNVYYQLATPIDTEITNPTLISQLEAIYNAPLYEQTNITQENNDLPMVLDITACKDNINGIKAFIRK